MKRYGLLGALIGFVVAVLGFTQIPAIAQQAELESAWEIHIAAGNEHLYLVKHNSVSGRTLILTCANNCGRNEEWHEYPLPE